jgi:hypothetical protein
VNPEEIAFFAPMPGLPPLYAALRGRLAERYPGMRVKVGKTQISFANRHLFAMVSLPRPRGSRTRTAGRIMSSSRARTIWTAN